MKFRNLLLICAFSCACAHKAPLPQLPGVPPQETQKADRESVDGQPPAAAPAAAPAAPPAAAPAGGEQAISEQMILDLEEKTGAGFEVFSGSVPPQPPAPVNLGGDGKLTLARYGTKEKITVTYREKKGEYNKKALAKIDRLMRCGPDNNAGEVSQKLVELLDALEDKLGKKGITVLSGCRAVPPDHAAKDAGEQSLHLLGWAADIRIPGAGPDRIKKYAVHKAVGGIGYYPYREYVHLDVGKSRYWVEQGPAKARHARKKASPRAKAGKTFRSPKKPAKK